MKPSEFMAWPPQDRGLALALQLLDESTTPHGNDSSIAMDPRSEGEFEVRTVQDHELAALEQWQKQNEHPPPGTRPYVVWLGSDQEISA